METVECIMGRMSIRGFKDEVVPKETLMEVIGLAQRSPSYKNTQPWEVVVVSGVKKKALSTKLVGLLESGKEACPDLPVPQSWPETEGQRIAALFKRRFELTGIDLSSAEMVKKAKQINFNFYGAPHAIYLFQDASLTAWSLFDFGLFAQTLMLAAHDKGLGTVPQAFATDYAAEVKEFLGIPKSKRLVLGISIGYPEMKSPANSFRTERDKTDNIVRWLE